MNGVECKGMGRGVLTGGGIIMKPEASRDALEALEVVYVEAEKV